MPPRKKATKVEKSPAEEETKEVVVEEPKPKKVRLKKIKCIRCGREEKVPANTRVDKYVCDECPPTYRPNDKRLYSMICPAGCKNSEGKNIELRPVKWYYHPWGESGLYQCDECGGLVDFTNNHAKMKWEFNEYIPGAETSWRATLKSCPDKKWAPENPTKNKKYKPYILPQKRASKQEDETEF